MEPDGVEKIKPDRGGITCLIMVRPSRFDSFKPGDIVRLKSGGPDMTVTEPSYDQTDWVCKWFGGKKLEHGQFPPEALEHVTKENVQG